MVIKIENTIDVGYCGDNIMKCFNAIIKSIKDCDSTQELKERMDSLEDTDKISLYFNYGFSGNHMWVTQKVLIASEKFLYNDRLLLVELNTKK